MVYNLPSTVQATSAVTFSEGDKIG